MSPIRSCQELSEDRIQTLGQERPGQPAVTSLTLAETIHLAERGPPWVERNSPDPRRRAQEGRNAHTPADMFHAHQHLRTTYKHPLYACTTQHARAISGNQQHNLRRCPHESLAHRQIRESEVTRCHHAEQTQINNHTIWRQHSVSYTVVLYLAVSFNSRTFFFSPCTYASL